MPIRILDILAFIMLAGHAQTADKAPTGTKLSIEPVSSHDRAGKAQRKHLACPFFSFFDLHLKTAKP